MGNLVVTPKMLEQEIGELRAGMEEKLEQQMGEFRAEINYKDGTYYRELNVIWQNVSEDYTGAAGVWKSCREKDKDVLSYYQNPESKVEFFDDLFVADNLFPVGTKSMAHLIPRDASCSLAWLRALSIITGIPIDPNVTSPLFDENLRGFVEGRALEEDETGMLVDGEGPWVDSENQVSVDREKASPDVPLKKWYWNFLKLPGDHYDHFDKVGRDKYMIICPIWNPEDEWKPGTGYRLMIAASPTTYTWLMGKRMLYEDDPQSKWLKEAAPNEPQKATDFLALTVKALAELLVENGDKDLNEIADGHIALRDEEGKESPLEGAFKAIEGAIPPGLSTKSHHGNSTAGGDSRDKKAPAYKKKAKDFVKKVKSVLSVRSRNLQRNGRKNVQVPKLRESKRQPILVADLGVYFQGNEHMIPDPFLVALKAAVSWSAFREQKLLPACPSDLDSAQDVGHEANVPEEIFTTAGEGSGQGDDDSVISLSEILTGQPGDSGFEENGFRSLRK